MQKSGLAGAGFPHQRQHFTALDIQRKAGENHQVGVAGAVDFREIARANEGLGHATATITQFERPPPPALHARAEPPMALYDPRAATPPKTSSAVSSTARARAV